MYRAFAHDGSKESVFRIAEFAAEAGQPGQKLSLGPTGSGPCTTMATTTHTTSGH